jgi:hypothetical protein
MLDRSDPYFAVSSFIFSFGVCCFMHVTRIDTRSKIKTITRKKGETREEDINTKIKCEREAEN